MMSSNPSSDAYVSGGESDKGAGKGGGSGGSSRDAGGSFEKMEAARKELYVRKTQIHELAKLIKSHEIKLSQYRGLFQHHVDAIDRLIQELQSQVAMEDKDSTQQGCNRCTRPPSVENKMSSRLFVPTRESSRRDHSRLRIVQKLR